MRHAGALAFGYAIHSLSLPSGTVLASGAIAQDGPRAFALAANGAVAAVVADADHPYIKRRIVVWRTGGSRVTIALPDDGTLRRAFRHYEGVGPIRFPHVSFSRVVLAGDGTPFATVENGFSGAYSGADRGVFRWTGARWAIVRAEGTEPASGIPPDFDIAAAELSPLRVGMTGEYTSSVYNIDAHQIDPSYHAPEAWVHVGIAKPAHDGGGAMRRLGLGTMTALAGGYACGYIGEQYDRIMPNNVNVTVQTPSALLWHAGSTKRLGRGVAFAVNGAGVAVGDDRTSANGGSLVTTRTPNGTQIVRRSGTPDGVPVRWDARGATRLAREPGTAFGIASDGTIVGTFARGAGFVRRDGATIALDTILPRAHVRGAYAINPHGRILVLTGTGGAPQLAYLDPV